MFIKFLVLGGGYFGFLGGGGSADFIFMGAQIFLRGFREVSIGVTSRVLQGSAWVPCHFPRFSLS